LVQDEDEEVEDIIEMTKGMLWDAKVSEQALDAFAERLSTYLAASSSSRQKVRPAVHRLEKAIDMKNTGMSSTIALSGQVDLEHGGKSQVS
jgi:ATP-binding cassette subfamily F protein 3